MRASPFRRRSAPRSRRTGKTPPVFRSMRSCSVAGGPRTSPWLPSPSTGPTGCSWVPRCPVRRPRPRREPSVNWFRRDSDGNFIWPGFGDNSRVLEWIVRRLEGQADARESAIGMLPLLDELDLEGVDISEEELAELFALDPQSWLAEADLTEEYFEQFGDRVPEALREQLESLRARLR